MVPTLNGANKHAGDLIRTIKTDTIEQRLDSLLSKFSGAFLDLGNLINFSVSGLKMTG